MCLLLQKSFLRPCPINILGNEGSHMMTQSNPLKKLAHMLMQVCVLVFSALKLVFTLNWGGGHSSWAHSWGHSFALCHYHTPCPPENRNARYTCHIRMLHHSMVKGGGSRSSTASLHCSLVAFPQSASICFCTDNGISGRWSNFSEGIQIFW